MSDTYRERVWQAIAGSLNTATGHYGDVCDTVREAVMAVRDEELVQARTERDQERDVAERLAAESNTLATALAELRTRLATAVTLPEDWRGQLSGVIEPGDIYGEDDVIALVESWRETST